MSIQELREKYHRIFPGKWAEYGFPKPGTFYHETEAANVDSIMESGLVARSPKYYPYEKRKVVWLNLIPSRRNSALPHLSRTEFYMLTVEIPDSEVSYSPYHRPSLTLELFFFIHVGDVPPEKIVAYRKLDPYDAVREGL